MSAIDYESAIAAGTVMLTAAEIAPRLGYNGRRGVEKVRALAGARIIPAFKPGRSYRFHWPTVVEAMNRRGMRR